MDNKKIGNLIAKLRKEKGLTQQELGDKVGVGSRAVSKWECGTTIPDISIINELSKTLGISSDELLSGKIYKSNTHSKKISPKAILLIISAAVILILTTILVVQYSNKTYVYEMNAVEYKKTKVDGYITYKNKNIELHINQITFNDTSNMNFPIKDYQYYIKIGDKNILGYMPPQKDILVNKIYSVSDIQEILKVNYTGKINLTKNKLLKEKTYLYLTLIDEFDNKKQFKIEISLYKKKG